MGRRLRYQVASSLDGFIARPDGSYDWLVADPSIDFAALYKQFDAAVMGRKTYEVGLAAGADGSIPGADVVVFSRTLPTSTSRGVRVTNEDPSTVVAELKKKKGRDIWLFGGGELFRYLLDGGLVDTVELAVMPVMIGEGIPVLPPGTAANLVLSDMQRLPSGIVVLAYSVKGSRSPPPKIRFVKKRSKPRGKPGSRGTATRKVGRRR